MDWSDAQRAAHGRATRVIYTVRSQPSWVTKLALGLALLVFVSIVVVLVVPALLVAAVVFTVGAGIASVKRRLVGSGGRSGAEDGRRRNVRVITRSRDTLDR